MTIQVIGQSFDVGESLTEHVTSCIKKKIQKYNQELVSANVVFSASPHKKVCASVKVQVKGLDLFAKSDDNDAYLAFNSALTDVETQLTKNLEKIKSHK